MNAPPDMINARMAEITAHRDPAARAGLVARLREEYPDYGNLIDEANQARLAIMREAAHLAYQEVNTLPRDERAAAHAAVRSMYPEIISYPLLTRKS
tara:strand:- start:874 stop:1164 length:291 start_codon:yes stop_codon:yes gene_type:complete